MDTEAFSKKSIIEALLFISEKPVLIEQIRRVLTDLDSVAIRSILEELKKDYDNLERGMRIMEVAGGFKMVSASELGKFVKKFYQKPPERVSKPALEVLAIIAYKQPITRMEIESLRGVDPSGIMRNLASKGLVRVAGRKKAPGRPFVYVTTRHFLEHFGLKSLKDLPKVDNFAKAEEGKNGPTKPTQED